jgi:hypothetical protein
VQGSHVVACDPGHKCRRNVAGISGLDGIGKSSEPLLLGGLSVLLVRAHARLFVANACIVVERPSKGFRPADLRMIGARAQLPRMLGISRGKRTLRVLARPRAEEPSTLMTKS